MDRTEKLRNIILDRYSSIREFSKLVDIPSTTLTSALDKGIGGMAIDRVIKICEFLDIDVKTFEPLNSHSIDAKLSKEEETLLKTFNELNSLGRKEAHKRVSELTEISKYTTPLNTTYVLAAHDDDLDSEEARANLEKAKALFKEMEEE